MKSKTIVSVVLALLATLAVAGRGQTAAGQQSAEQLYKSGLYEEEVGGDLQKAVAIYQDILKRFPDSREIAARAQLHIGLCFEKLGTQEAEKAFQRVVDNYPEQSEAVQTAKGKLARLLQARALAGTGDTGLRLRQVWTGPETDILGAVSPDGRFLSFVDWKTGDLAVRDLATGTNRRLTNKGPWTQSPDFALFSKWSPDSRRIVYQWYNTGVTSTLPRKDEIYELRVFDIEKSTARTVHQSRGKTEYVHPFDWSRDGQSILAAIYTDVDSDAARMVQLSLIPVDGGPVKVLKSQSEVSSAGWDFAFSPDGKYIAYDIRQKDKTIRRDILLLSTEGDTETPVIEHPADDRVIGWTPDSGGLLFMSDRTGTQDVWFVRVAGGQPQGDPHLLKSGIGRMEPMGITSRGALFFGIAGGRTDVYEASIDPQTGKILSPAKRAALLNEGNNAYPDYSPDGKQLAYISTQSMPAIHPQRFLGILTPETGQVRELRPDLQEFSYPRWAPDGRSISVEGSGRDGRKGIYRVDIQSGNFVPIVLIDKGKEIYSHRWSKDGKRLFYTEGERNGKTASLLVHDLESGREEPLSGAPSDAMDIDISPDGKELALLNRFGRRVVRVMPTAGGSPREITSFEHGDRGVISPAWSADGRYLYFYKLQGTPELGSNIMDLYRVSVDGGEPQKLDLAMVRFRHFSVHPDGRRIAFSSMGTNPENSQVWVMENFLPADKTGK